MLNMAGLSKKTLRDDRILELFANGKNAQEVSELLGITPEYAYKRVKELLADEDVFDTIENRKLLVYQLKSLHAKANDMLENLASDKSWAQGVASITKLIEVTYDIQVREEATSLEEIEAATRAQAAILIRVVEQSYQRARELLATEYPEVDLNRIDAAFEQGLIEA